MKKVSQVKNESNKERNTQKSNRDAKKQRNKETKIQRNKERKKERNKTRT